MGASRSQEGLLQLMVERLGTLGPGSCSQHHRQQKPSKGEASPVGQDPLQRASLGIAAN